MAQSTMADRLAREIRVAEMTVQQPSAQNDGTAWWKLGTLYQDAARYGDAERCYARAVGLLQHGDPTWLANALDSMGTMYVETGDYAKAEPLEKQALAMREAGGDSMGEGRSWMHLAMLSLGEQDPSSAVRYGQMAVLRLVPRGKRGGDAGTPEEQMAALIDLALARCAERDCREAIDSLKRAHRLAVHNHGASDFEGAYTEFLLGYAEWKSGNDREAARRMKSGAAGLETQLTWGHPTFIALMTQYGIFLEQAGQLQEAAAVRAKLARLEASVTADQLASTNSVLAPMQAGR